jgi:hypothetical protein
MVEQATVRCVSLPSPKSRLALFRQRYKQFPKLGMKIDVVTDENGYWKIAL